MILSLNSSFPIQLKEKISYSCAKPVGFASLALLQLLNSKFSTTKSLGEIGFFLDSETLRNFYCRILKENYYRNLATTSQISGLTFCSFLGLFIKDYLFGANLDDYKLGLCVIAFFLGTMMLVISFRISLLIDTRKNIKRGDFR